MKLIKKSKKRISKKLKKFLLNNNLDSVYQALKNNSDNKYYFDFSTTDKSKISYYKINKIPQKSHLIYNKDYRLSNGIQSKIGKLIADSVSQSDIIKVSSLLYEKNIDVNFEIVSNIQYWYDEENYNKNYDSGNLYSSCMRYKNSQDAILFYEELTSKNVQLLILKQDNKLIGRSLIWYNVNYKGEKITYLDRCYAVNDNIQDMFYRYAESKGYIHYKNKDSELSINLGLFIDTSIPVPYFDTFTEFNTNNQDMLSNRSGNVSLTNTDYLSIDELTENRITCECCQCTFDSDNEGGYSDYNGEYLCDDCSVYSDSDELIRVSDSICIDDNYYHVDNDNIVQVNNTYYLTNSDEIIYSDVEGEYILIDDSIIIDDEVYHYQDDSIIQIDDEYYLKNDDSIIQIDDEYYLKNDDNIIQIDNEYYLIDSDEIIEIDYNYYLKNSDEIYYDTKLNKYIVSQCILL